MFPTTDPRSAAAGWIARTRDPAFGDWEALTRWLEEKPANNLAYEAALDAHDAAGSVLVRDDAPGSAGCEEAAAVSRRSRRAPFGWAVGLAAVLAVVAVPLLRQKPAEYSLTTDPGQTRTITLGDGTRITLNGGSRLILDRRDGRSAKLEYGEADFAVRHDRSKPFVVDAGGTRIQDVGTRFDVVRTARSTEVAVAEGAVLFDPDGASVRLQPGRLIRTSDDSPILDIADRDPATIGSWTTGTLLYRNATFADVAIGLARAIGVSVSVSHDISARRFSGGIVVRGVEQSRLFRNVASLLDVQATRYSDGWRLSAKGSGTH
jgi:transmembrane sensor